jgi:Family of unknown function (DUF6286)
MRLVNRLLSLLLGLVVVAAGLAAIGSTLTALFGPAELQASRRQVLTAIGAAASLPLDSRVGWGVGAGLVVAGVLLLIFELRPRPPRHLQLGAHDGLTWWLDRQSLERVARRMLTSRTPIHDASIRLRRDWRITVRAEGDQRARAEIHRELEDLLRRLGRSGGSRLRVRLRQRRRVV